MSQRIQLPIHCTYIIRSDLTHKLKWILEVPSPDNYFIKCIYTDKFFLWLFVANKCYVNMKLKNPD